MSLQHFVSHISEIEAYFGEGSYRAKRLVHFGGAGTGGICGYAHAAELYLAPGTKLLSHWHQDREAIFYCLEGEGVFLLDGLERRVGPGDGMFIPLGAVHGGFNAGAREFRFLDCALFTDTRSPLEVGEGCFARIGSAPTTTARGVTWKSLFPRETFGNQAIVWWGEVWLEPGQRMQPDRYEDDEQIFYVLEGRGRLWLGPGEVELRPGSIVHILPDVVHALANAGESPMRLVGSRSGIGRVLMPDYYRRLILSREAS
jgi:quercetin dioxygenase-like cupin family protein